MRRVGSVQNKASFVSFRAKFAGGNKNEKRENEMRIQRKKNVRERIFVFIFDFSSGSIQSRVSNNLRATSYSQRK